ncbi:putative Xre family DNA binding protein [Microlunatus phosphovorus NM-1]|uniref:Putative Xre family DNA binding protein n=1 Tax=Microlunatus phosphovorus (strain ATCC 700054 / DSM 10555 / JCM 9379 / NBRC 101784 / NCIMB 13414 / VKM Ac-1990 / NM-1) TaxID=1032480 RepID=F5XRQ7_MICPN|nr:helix-turn-helix domain-containing protein [Microlunatus phosphovorus]BAK37120.1 putative Xre family DNA binding protein [Microlunatus phosphovorus NM-1]
MSDVVTARATVEAGHDVGARLRDLRHQQGMSARTLASALGISPSAVSQIERGVLQPSVSRLIAITDALGVPLAAVFDTSSDPVAETIATAGGFALQRAEQASVVTLETGVTFRRLSPGRTPGVDYFESTYPPGSTAHDEGSLFRHDGYEVGTIISGELTIDFDEERVVLRAGDAISYPCSRPHRLHNTGTEDTVAQWLIVHAAR